MECPRCSNTLSTIKVDDLEVDVCQGGCGGLWFDIFELKKVDELHEIKGESLLNIERNENLEIDYSKRINCPKCTEVVMMRHYWSPKKEIEIDECPYCGGYWIDAGELYAIRNQFATEEERTAEFEKVWLDLFGEELTSVEADKESALPEQRTDLPERRSKLLSRLIWWRL